MAALTWRRERPGRQVSTDGCWAVESDGYERGPIGFMDRGEFVKTGDGGEWAVIDMRQPDVNVDWRPTMREAKVECERLARLRAQSDQSIAERWGR